MRIVRLSTRDGVSGILSAIRRSWSLEEAMEAVKPIVEDVESRCYDAVYEYSCRLDGACYRDPTVPPDSIPEYEEKLDYKVLEAIDRIIESVREYHKHILPVEAGARGSRLAWLPIESAAIYVPGGRNPYPSTAIMTVVPASVAGVREIHVLTPPRMGLKADPATVVAAYRSGATMVYAVGGPQAIAGVAFACKPLPRVDLVAGPGGRYVQAAKLLVHGRVGIDMLAGPTELMIIAGPRASPRRVAMEALAQAEHGPSSMVVVASWSMRVLDGVMEEIQGLAPGGDMADIYLVEAGSLGEALQLADWLAPEHLLLLDVTVDGIPSAGAVSLGVPTAYLDYAAGPSHVLPTGGVARWRGGLSVYDFLRPVAVVEGVDPGLMEAARVLALYEGFEWHCRSLEEG